MIAFRIDHQDFRAAAFDLAADDEAGFKVLSLDGALFLLLAAEVTNIVSCISDAVHAQQVLRRILSDVAFDFRKGGLGGGEVAGGQDNELFFAVNAKAEHLAVGGDLIDACVGQGVRTEDHSGIHRYCDAICHGLLNSPFIPQSY